MFMVERIVDRMAEEAAGMLPRGGRPGLARRGCGCGGGCGSLEGGPMLESAGFGCGKMNEPFCRNPLGVFGGWSGPVSAASVLAASAQSSSSLAAFTRRGRNIYRITFPTRRRTIGMTVSQSIRERLLEHRAGGRTASATVRQWQKGNPNWDGVVVEAAILSGDLTNRQLHVVESLLQYCCSVTDWSRISGSWTFDD